MPPLIESCHTCRFCGELRFNDGTNRTICRRRPPQTFVLTDDRLQTRYPSVTSQDWCGEWEVDGELVSNTT